MNVHFIYRYIIINMYTGAWAAIYSELAETSLLIIEHRTLNQSVWALPLHSLSLLLLLLPMMLLLAALLCSALFCHSVCMSVHVAECFTGYVFVIHTSGWSVGGWALFCCCYLCVFVVFLYLLLLLLLVVLLSVERALCSFIYSPSFLGSYILCTQNEIERDRMRVCWRKRAQILCIYIFMLFFFECAFVVKHTSIEQPSWDISIWFYSWYRLKPENFALCLIVAAKSNNNQQSNVNLLNRSGWPIAMARISNW